MFRRKSLILLVVISVGLGQGVALNAVYVNNQKLDKYELDKIKLLSPVGTSQSYVTKSDLVTKDNFTNPLNYYQYLVGNDPSGYVDLLWGKNKTYLPSIFRSTTTASPPTVNTVNFADDLSPIENTLNNTTPIYKGDYHIPTVLTSTIRPAKQIKKPKIKPPPTKNETKISRETLELLREYFNFNCTLKQDISTTPSPKPSTKKPKVKVKPKKTPVTTASTSTTRPSKASNKLPTSTSSKISKTSPSSKKPYRPVVYVEPPVIATLGGVLESVYNYMQDALVSTEYISIEDEQPATKRAPKQKKRKKTKRNSLLDASAEEADPTLEPFPLTSKQYVQQQDPKRVTIAGLPLGSGNNKNKLTTNIHVTSEYSPATPATVLLPQIPLDDKDESSEESESEEGNDYYGGFANASYEDQADDEDSQEDESGEDYGGSEEDGGDQGGPGGGNKDYDYGEENDKVNSPIGDDSPQKIKKQRPASFEEYSDEVDDYDSEEDTGGGGGFFTGIFSSISRFVRSFGFAPRTAVEYDDYDESRSTTPRMFDLKKRPTRSADRDTQTQIERIHESTEKQQPWYHYPAYMFNEINEEPEIQIPPSNTNTNTNDADDGIGSDWYHLMMPWDFFNPWLPWDDKPNQVTNTEAPTQPTIVTTASTTTTQVDSKPSWFPNLFGAIGGTETSPSKPTSVKPLIPFLPASDPLQRPEHWLGVIAQHVFTTTRTPRTTTQVPSTTHITKPTKVFYSGYQLWRVYPRTPENVRFLEDYRYSPEGVKLQWWKGPSLRGANDILVPPHMLETFGENLEEERMTKEVAIRNLGQAILYENPKMTRREQIENEVLHGHPLTWYRYHRYGDIVKFMNYLGRRFPKNVELIHIGRSFEGRPLTVVKVGFGGGRGVKKFNKTKKRYTVKKRGKRAAIFIEAGAHGREWIGPSVATWILDALTKAIASNDTELENMKSMDWYVLPMLNPDGYEYSHEYDRMWRKTRSRHVEAQGSGILASALNWLQSHSSLSVNSDETCYGTDLNRNWDYRWNEEGASKSGCSEHYAGHKPLSEPETKALASFLQNGRRNIQIFLSLHSYGQMISYPGDKRSGSSEDRFGDVHEMAAVAVEALRGSGSQASYRVDSENEMSYHSSGTSTQFARFEAGIRYSYTVELPDTGTHGFLLPPSGIESVSRDTLELVKGMVDFI